MQVDIFRRKFARIIIVSIIVIFPSIALALGVKSFYALTVIRIEGNGIRAIIDEKRVPKNLLFFPSDKFREEILKNNPLLSDVRFIKRYPHELAIVPVPRISYVILRSENREVFVDREGFVLGDSDGRTSLPIIELQHVSIHTGEKLEDRRVGFVLSFLEAFAEILKIKSITNPESTQFIVKTDNTDIYITQDKSISEITATLQTLITGFRIKGTLPSVVDLRFDKPVVKF